MNKKNILLCPLLDIVPNFLTRSADIFCMIGASMQKMIESEIENESFVFYYFDYLYLEREIDKWQENADLFKEVIEKMFEEKVTTTTIVVHTYFEEEMAVLLERVNMLNQYSLIGLIFEDEESEEDEISFYFQIIDESSVFQN